MTGNVDTSFGFHSDTPPCKDPHFSSPSLRMYRQRLWNKELPSGGRFELAFGPGSSLVFRSALGVFHLASETITSGLLERGRPSYAKSRIMNCRSTAATMTFPVGVEDEAGGLGHPPQVSSYTGGSSLFRNSRLSWSASANSRTRS